MTTESSGRKTTPLICPGKQMNPNYSLFSLYDVSSSTSGSLRLSLVRPFKVKKNINHSGKPLKGRLGKEMERESKKEEEKIMR